MKKTIATMGATLLCLTAAFSQGNGENKESQTPQKQVQTWDAHKNPTVDSIESKYRDKLITAGPASLATEDIFPAIGHFESTTNPETPALSISADAVNKGIVWIDGLPQGRIKAMLRKSPATYKIPAQKTEEGKEVAEGTLIYDKEMNTLSICIGKPYDIANPGSAFMESPAGENQVAKTSTKAKKTPMPLKPWVYTGTKITKTTAMKEMN